MTGVQTLVYQTSKLQTKVRTPVLILYQGK